MTGYGMQGTPILTHDNSDIDRTQCHRIVPMKVLVLGLCRTGTMCACFLTRTDYKYSTVLS